MNILLVLIPVTLVIVVIAVWLFFWAVNHQQFDDLDSPEVLPLLDDQPAPAQDDAARARRPTAPDEPVAGATPLAAGDAADDRPA